jgi:hypothetical protein
VIEAHDSQACREVPCGGNERERICRSTETDIPDGEFDRRSGDAIQKAKLPNVESLRFGHRSDHRMKRFGIRERADAVGAIL